MSPINQNRNPFYQSTDRTNPFEQSTQRRDAPQLEQIKPKAQIVHDALNGQSQQPMYIDSGAHHNNRTHDQVYGDQLIQTTERLE